MAHLDRVNLLALALLTLGILFTASGVSAETIEAGYRGCEFADAVRAANTNQPAGNCRAGDPGHDHIFVDGIVPILEPPVEITEDLAIVGDRDTSTLDGQGRYSFFHVAPGIKLHLQDLFMSNGYGTRETGQARVESGGWIGFSTASVINCKGVKDIVAADDATVHFGHKASVCGKAEPFNPHPPIRQIPGSDDKTLSDRREEPTRERKRVAEPATRPAVYTCEHLPDYVLVRAMAGTRSGIQCQVIDHAGVGIQAVIDMGIVAAVNIWGYVEPGVEVCLRGQGRLLFLDAAYPPRPYVSIKAQRQGDMNCASFNRAGSLVLVGGDDARRVETADQSAVLATAALNLRNVPAGATILGVIPEGATLEVSTRQPGWLEVIFNRVRGWVSAEFVVEVGGSI